MNIYLDKFDKEMMAKGIRIERYVDDILIFAKTKAEVGRYREIATNILEKKLKLTINKDRTHITNVDKGVPFLGFMI